tara:strand:- start:23 stop:310 length:288 start_codon:yes stop_codon:yes gene_type:complete
MKPQKWTYKWFEKAVLEHDREKMSKSKSGAVISKEVEWAWKHFVTAKAIAEIPNNNDFFDFIVNNIRFHRGPNGEPMEGLYVHEGVPLLQLRLTD